MDSKTDIIGLHPNNMTLDANNEEDMAFLKSELTSRVPYSRNALRFQNAAVIFDKPLTEHQADTLIRLLGDIDRYRFDIMDVCVHVANLAIILGIKVKFRTKFRFLHPRVSRVYAKMCRILNKAVADGEITPWNTPETYTPSYIQTKKQDQEENNNEKQ